MPIRAGKYRHRVRIEQASRTQSVTGHITLSWSTVATVWAQIMPVSGREYHDAQAVNEETTVRFRIRYRSGIDESMRLIDPLTNRIYDIQSVLHLDHGNRMIEIMAVQTNDRVTA